MNVLIYAADPAIAAPKVEEVLRAELAAPGPVPYEMNQTGAAHEKGAISHDLAATFFGGNLVPLFTMDFDIQHPRPAKLLVNMMRRAALVKTNCYAGPLVYTAEIPKPIADTVTLGRPKFFGTAEFTGHPAASEKLNANKKLRKKAEEFAVLDGGLPGFQVTMPRHLDISPYNGGARLTAATLPTSSGFSANLRSAAFFELLTLVEAAL